MWSLSRRLTYSANKRLPVEKAWRLMRSKPAIVQNLEPLFSPLREALNRMDWRGFDLLQVEHSHLASAVAGLAVPLPKVLDWHNVYSVMEARRAAEATSIGAKIKALRELSRVRRTERRVAGWFERSLAVSEADAEAIRYLAPDTRVSVVPNGVDCDYFRNPEPWRFESQTLIFTGTMDYEPNEEGVLFFVEAVLPLLLSEAPDIQFYVVGQRPSATVRDLETRYSGRVHVTGYVDDVRPYLQRAAVSVVPLLNGGGTRLKILEAMAMQKAVVSTQVGAEGLEFTDGQELAIANEPDAFARSILSLLANRELSSGLASRGHRATLERYAWSQVAKRLEEAWEKATNGDGRPNG